MPRKTPAKAYRVGYGKPPSKHQFKRGASGNPRGRPRQTPAVADLLDKELRRKISIAENGKISRITRIDAIVRQTVKRAVSGDGRAANLVLQLMQQLDISPIPPRELTITADIPVLPATLRTPGAPVEMQQISRTFEISEDEYDNQFGRKW